MFIFYFVFMCFLFVCLFFFFFFQAEDGIRDGHVTGVQTCALPIYVLNSLIHELRTSKSFIFSVAFITEDGLATLKTHLLKLENVSLRITHAKGFHAKGYIFEQENYYSLIIGSSNLTTSLL